ncbi:MAG: LuxR C-terminal-related transcriptional regulator [Rhodobacteraceae bacterium]|nr:LuxR C-terminal-related transcriptional regulator [Paracoccaceae bacterium]
MARGPRGRAIEGEARAEIVDRLYEVALDPIRLEELLDVWEGRIAPLRADAAPGAIEDADLEAHVGRASVFLDRFEATRQDGGYRSVLAEIPRRAAFVSDGHAIVAFNPVASRALGLAEGNRLEELPFEEGDIATLGREIRQIAAGRGGQVATLRIRHSRGGAPVILRVSRVESAHSKPLALVVSTELAWPEGFDETVQEAFGLTPAEAEIVQGICLGLAVRDIARRRRRSAETVRTQIRSILAKTETHSQSELVRVVLGLMDVAMTPPGRSGGAARAVVPASVETRTLRLGDGRRLDWIEFGDPRGAPLLYMHLDYGLIRWPRPAEHEAARRGLRVIVPIRAGYGATSPVPKGADHVTAVALDYAAVLDHLGVTRLPVIALGADLRFALKLSLLNPGLVTGILGCAAQLPLSTPAQYERMDKWQRFILANARYAPKVLPFLVKAGFSLARRLGKERFFAQVNGGSPADMETFADPDVREAVLGGSDVTLSERFSAHEAFALECLSSERDWSALIHAARVPVRLLQGDQDPQTPVQTVRELMEVFPALEVEFLPRTGQLLFFKEWRRALDEVMAFLPEPVR